MKLEVEKLEKMDPEVLDELPFSALDMDDLPSYELNLLISLMYDLEEYNNNVPDKLKLTLHLNKDYDDENFDYDTFNLNFNDDICVSGLTLRSLDDVMCALISLSER